MNFSKGPFLSPLLYTLYVGKALTALAFLSELNYIHVRERLGGEGGKLDLIA